ncbi:MAG: glycosyltransferase family 39 protein [Methanobacterium paludis]|nr:glycosyltransferase family 39 protein [Methanobacterium paludis]
MNYHLNEHKTGYSNLLIAIFLTILTVVTRVPFVSKYLFEWDSVNFALSFNKYDIAMQQPQSPGYILYVYLGKVVNSIFHDPNTTMVFISIVFSILTVLLVYFLAKQILSQKIAIISALLLIFSPIFWFYGEITTIYPVESFLAVLIVYTSYQILRGKTRFIYISALTLGIAGGFRQELIIFMLPLWLYCLHHHFRENWIF